MPASASPTRPDDGPVLSDGAKAGIGVACSLIGLAAVLGLVFLMKKKRDRRRRYMYVGQHYPADTKPNLKGNKMLLEDLHHSEPQELSPQTRPSVSELSGSTTLELDSDRQR